MKRKNYKEMLKEQLEFIILFKKSRITKEIYSIPDEELRKIYNGIVELKMSFLI